MHFQEMGLRRQKGRLNQKKIRAGSDSAAFPLRVPGKNLFKDRSERAKYPGIGAETKGKDQEMAERKKQHGTGIAALDFHGLTHNVFMAGKAIVCQTGISPGQYSVRSFYYDPVKQQIPITAFEQDNIAPAHSRTTGLDQNRIPVRNKRCHASPPCDKNERGPFCKEIMGQGPEYVPFSRRHFLSYPVTPRSVNFTDINGPMLCCAVDSHHII
jgi:hypothetical protein